MFRFCAWPLWVHQHNFLPSNICRPSFHGSSSIGRRVHQEAHHWGVSQRLGVDPYQQGIWGPPSEPPQENILLDETIPPCLILCRPTPPYVSPVPITLLHKFCWCLHNDNAHQRAIIYLLFIGLFLLYLIGYCCKGGFNTRSVPLHICNIQFYIRVQLFCASNAPLSILFRTYFVGFALND